MGFGTAVSSMVAAATTNANDLFADFVPFIALFVGVIVLGMIVGFFVNR